MSTIRAIVAEHSDERTGFIALPAWASALAGQVAMVALMRIVIILVTEMVKYQKDTVVDSAEHLLALGKVTGTAISERDLNKFIKESQALARISQTKTRGRIGRYGHGIATKVLKYLKSGLIKDAFTMAAAMLLLNSASKLMTVINKRGVMKTMDDVANVAEKVTKIGTAVTGTANAADSTRTTLRAINKFSDDAEWDKAMAEVEQNQAA